MANGKVQPFTSLDQSKHHCYTLSTTCTLFKLASEVGPRTIKQISTMLATQQWEFHLGTNSKKEAGRFCTCSGRSENWW